MTTETTTTNDAEKTAEARRERAEQNAQQFIDFREAIQKETFRPIRTGLDFYDELMQGGAQSQTLTVLIAEQGAGKSMLLQQLAESIATTEHRRVIYLNFEMSSAQLLARAISARVRKRGNMRKSQRDILRGYKWNEKERAEILEVLDEYERESLPYISYNPQGVKRVKPTLEGLKEYEAELLQHPQPAPVLFVDYLQLIQNGSGAKQMEVKDRLTQVLIDLKEYAIKGNTFVYLISAINRPSFGNSNSNITATRARDTSAIEYQADYLIALQNAKDQEAANRKGLQRMELKLLKSRDGKSGNYTVVYRDGENNRFTDEYEKDGRPIISDEFIDTKRIDF